MFKNRVDYSVLVVLKSFFKKLKEVDILIRPSAELDIVGDSWAIRVSLVGPKIR